MVRNVDWLWWLCSSFDSVYIVTIDCWFVAGCAWLAYQGPGLYPYSVLIRGLCGTEGLPPRAALGNILFRSAMIPSVGGPETQHIHVIEQ